MSDKRAKKILVTGATGQVGSYLAEMLAPFGTVSAPGRSELDLCSPANIRAFVLGLQPDWIVHPAAYTAVDRAESEPETCFAVNAGATAVLAEVAQQLAAPLLTFSTDYVFNGRASEPYREGDATDPVNVYGASKLAAEQALAASGAVYVNLRTSWVYSVRGSNFVKTMLRLGAEREELRVVSDQQGCPTSARDAAQAVVDILKQSPEHLQANSGTYHLAGTGDTTWYGFASHLLAVAREVRPERAWASVEPVSSTEFPTPALRPANSRLNCAKLRETFGVTLPPWQVSAREAVQELLQ